ncbi:5-methyltetrahydropteroyltriglutamate--homocysteine S-methyltransferase [Gardnerella greenwoodii]|uniref:5-methyltetrahydropteroyltriglutamate-- homocysteine S-methyltransferase n=1 Tax=Gardnerella greenwoodii TaxID=2914925 RepID=UPI00030E7FBF|nr:5-methyltetrahydropteroyltriglutamate--homocysteine S-methyltransferase [Gardnerella greenwoodii]
MSTVLTSVSGFPRIGADRELKKIIERYWKQDASLDEVREVAQSLRAKHWRLQAEAGIDLIPSNDFSYYDQMLDTAILLGAVPERYNALNFEHAEDTLFAIARGYQGERGDVTALPMKKWFTTNYHYIVPEVENPEALHLAGTKPFDEFLEARAQGLETKPVLIGPYTFLKLARTPEAQELEVTESVISALANAYASIVKRFGELRATWLQFDEPYLALDKEDGDLELFEALYKPLLDARSGEVKILLNTYFGNIADAYETVNNLGFDGVGVDLVEGKDENLAAIERYGVNNNTTLFAGVVNGRNIWRNDYAVSLGLIDALRENVTDRVAVSSACSLLHVPFSTVGEDALGADVLRHFAFAVEKLKEIRDIANLAAESDESRKSSNVLAKNQALFDGSRVKADADVANRLSNLKDSDFVRLPERAERQRLQKEALGLPDLPTTTIGSFPQTKDIRNARASLRKGEISSEAYDEFMRDRIAKCIEHQEQIGLDVLVHGEFERNDMVEYFGQHLRGFKFTKNAWVQSYGTRCVKPPIVWSDVSRESAITVAWSAYAQSCTNRIVKGMLTGPVTILNWSWPREDITHEQQTQQLALAIRDEVLDLERAGIRVIQIDEAALREKLPLRRSDWHKKYLDWAIAAFRLVHSAVAVTTQIHTHMCYSEFNDIIRDIDAMDADVISFEASRGDLVVLDAIHDVRFETEAGPGVYDIHSPRVPGRAELVERIHEILRKMPAEKLWINPDCGLKTRGDAETWPSLENLVAAAKEVRAELSNAQSSNQLSSQQCNNLNRG